MNKHWRIEFCLLGAASHPHMREDWTQLAAEWADKEGVSLDQVRAALEKRVAL